MDAERTRLHRWHHIPSDYVWSMDLEDDPEDTARFRRLPKISDVVPLVAEIG